MTGSLYCPACGGDMHKQTCTCGHRVCKSCAGCATCGVHERRCPNKAAMTS